MKREFLQNLKVEDQPLPKEVIDAIMAENGRDIEHTRAGFADYGDLQQKVQQMEEEKHNFDAVRQEAKTWKDKFLEAEETHARELNSLQFADCLKSAITAAGGRSAKAIEALLDLDTLQNSENREEAVATALEELKEKNGFLFEETAVPPRFPSGTGAQPGNNMRAPATLAGALHEKYERRN